MKFNLYQFILLILIGLSLSGCGRKAVNAKDFSVLKDGISATLTLDPIDPVAMEKTRITLYFEENNLPLEGAEVILNLSMPGMKMPENTNTTVEDRPGSYSTTTLFTMSGDWQVQADVSENAKIHTFTFDFRVQ